MDDTLAKQVADSLVGRNMTEKREREMNIALLRRMLEDVRYLVEKLEVVPSPLRSERDFENERLRVAFDKWWQISPETRRRSLFTQVAEATMEDLRNAMRGEGGDE